MKTPLYYTATVIANGSSLGITVNGCDKFGTPGAAEKAARLWVERAVASGMTAGSFLPQILQHQMPTGALERRSRLMKVLDVMPAEGGLLFTVQCEIQWVGSDGETVISTTSQDTTIFVAGKGEGSAMDEDDITADNVTNRTLTNHLNRIAK